VSRKAAYRAFADFAVRLLPLNDGVLSKNKRWFPVITEEANRRPLIGSNPDA
jgi:hypothetical protein